MDVTFIQEKEFVEALFDTPDSARRADELLLLIERQIHDMLALIRQDSTGRTFILRLNGSYVFFRIDGPNVHLINLERY